MDERIDKKPEEKTEKFSVPKDVPEEDMLEMLELNYSVEKSGQKKEMLKKQIAELRRQIEEQLDQENLSNKKRSERVGLIEKGDTAHAGPEFSEKEFKKGSLLKEDDEIGTEVKFRRGKRFQNRIGKILPKFLSTWKNRISNVSTDPTDNKAFMRSMSNRGYQKKEAIEKIPLEKKRRTIKKELKQKLNDSKNWEETTGKLDPTDFFE
jgi:hypothetical protein